MNKKILQDLVKNISKLLRSLKSKGKPDERQLKYFIYEYKKTSNFWKLYLLPKIHEIMQDKPGKPVISNCGTPTEKISEFLDSQLKPIMQKSWSYIIDSGDFMRIIKNLRDIPAGAFSVTSDVVGLYPSIPYRTGLEALNKALDERENKFIFADDIVKIVGFVSEKGQVKQ